MLVYGINAVIEALKARRVVAIRVSLRGGERLQQVVSLAERDGIPVRRVDPASIDRETRGGVHQGVVADVRTVDAYSLTDVVNGAVGPPLLIVLDGIEDPQNVGAMIRTADAAGVHGVIRQTRRAAALDGIAAKASAGAVAHVKIVHVVNIARALEDLKGLGVWSVGLDGAAPRRYDQVDLTMPVALVFGAEGAGLRRLVRARCDFLASIPMRGRVESLNVSVAAGVVLFEAVRQRGATRNASQTDR